MRRLTIRFLLGLGCTLAIGLPVKVAAEASVPINPDAQIGTALQCRTIAPGEGWILGEQVAYMRVTTVRTLGGYKPRRVVQRSYRFHVSPARTVRLVEWTRGGFTTYVQNHGRKTLSVCAEG